MNLSLALAGELSLWVALLLAAWSVVVSALAATLGRDDLARSGERAFDGIFALLLLSLAGLLVALLSDDLAIVYVARHAGEQTSWVWRAAALWTGGEGALLIWALAHSAAFARAVREIRRSSGSSAAASCVSGVVLLILLGALTLTANPFERFVWVPPHGAGLFDLLRHPALLLQPPLAIVALALSVIPFAVLMSATFGASAARAPLVELARRWLLGSWCAATAAILLGMWWASEWPATHDQWMRGGAARSLVLFWLAVSLALHLPRRTPAAAHLALLGAPFVIAAATPLLPIENVLDVLHAIEHTGAAPWLLLLSLLAALALTAMVTRAVRRGTFLLAVKAPVTSVREVGTMVTATGVVVLTVGLLAAARFRVDEHVRLAAGEEATVAAHVVGRWTFSHQGISRRDEYGDEGQPLAQELLVAVTIRGANDGALIIVAPTVRQRVDAAGRPTAPPVAGAAVHRTAAGELFLALEEITEEEIVGLRVVLTPMVALVWLGGALMFAGGIVRLVAAGRG